MGRKKAEADLGKLIFSTPAVLSTATTEQLQKELERRNPLKPYYDPFTPQIQKFRTAQAAWEKYGKHSRREFPNALPSVLIQWEYAFCAGYIQGVEPRYENFSANHRFNNWVQGFEHRLPVLADKFFKMGFEDGQKNVGIKVPDFNIFAKDRADRERYLMQKDAPFVIRSRRLPLKYFQKTLPSGSPKFTPYLEDARKYETLPEAVAADQEFTQRYPMMEVRVSGYHFENKRK